MTSGDTIVALSTPPGRGALALIRASGPQVPDLIRQLNGGVLPAPRTASLRVLHDAQGRTLDQGVLTFYPAPASATGEDVLEISCHGAPAVVEALLFRLRSLGVRPAEPGEFSRRAFEAGKMDLAQAPGSRRPCRRDHGTGGPVRRQSAKRRYFTRNIVYLARNCRYQGLY